MPRRYRSRSKRRVSRKSRRSKRKTKRRTKRITRRKKGGSYRDTYSHTARTQGAAKAKKEWEKKEWEERDAMCSICLKRLKDKRKIYTTNCGHKFHIGCKDGKICPEIIQREGKKPMCLDDFLRGFDFIIGSKVNV